MRLVVLLSLLALLSVSQTAPTPKPSNPLQYLLASGVANYNQKNYKLAAAELEQVVAQLSDGPQKQELTLYVGQSYFLLNQFPAAEKWLARANAAPETCYMLGNAQVRLRKPADAVVSYACLFQLDAGSAQAKLAAGQMMYRLEEMEMAATTIKAALQTEPKLSGGHQILGEIAAFQGNLDLAVAEFKAELLYQPNASMAWYRLGETFSRLERWSEALPALQKSIWINPNYSAPYIVLGKVYSKVESNLNAEAMYRRALQLDPQNGTAMYQLGRILFDSGRQEEGRKWMQQSRQKPTDNR
jgi:tetratricopeptide (TPR) repeat protein